MQPQDLRIGKTRCSGFIHGASTLDGELRHRGIDTIVVAGTLTNWCCEATVRDATMLNYRAILVSDANAALRDDEHNMALANTLTTFGDVLSTDEVIGALARDPTTSPARDPAVTAESGQTTTS